MKKQLQKIEEVKTPIVGKFYLVACATINLPNRLFSKSNELMVSPIIPVKHVDKEFAPRVPAHYHYDTRFQCLDYGKKKVGQFSSLVVTASHVERIEYRRRKCIREYGGIITYPKIIKDWANQQIGKSCKDRICPHKGAKMVLVDGKLICPMHNLVGCPTTQKITGIQ